MIRFYLALSVAFAVVALAGCAGSSGTAGTPQASTTPTSAPKTEPTKATLTPEQIATNAEIAAERAKLSPEDRKLVEAQEWCVSNNDERLGEMGAPIKLTIKGQPVFICCKGCKKSAEADPDATLAKLAELKAKAAKK